MLLLAYKPSCPALPEETKDFSKTVYKVGDRVRITCPEFFTRVGYPMSLDEARGIVQKEYDDYIRTMLDSSGLYQSQPKRVVLIPGALATMTYKKWPPTGGIRWRAYHRIVDGLAMMLLEQEGFGGNTREIHTTRQQCYMGMEFQVLSKRVVKTGMYDPPWSYQCDLTGEWDGYSGGLSNSKTHVILELAYPCEEVTELWSSGLWIERVNVKKIG